MKYEIGATKCHEHLLNECPSRNKKIVEETYVDAVNFIEDIEIVLCRMALILGDIQPENDADESIRDLFSEVFDSLLCSKNLIYEGYIGTAFPMMRRGYELMEMMIYFILNPDKETAWRGKSGKNGQHIKQCDIRQFFKTHPRGGDVAFKQELYNHFSDASHTNKKYIPYRQLGIANEFTLGNFAYPSDVGVIEQLMRLVQLYTFLRHIVFTHYGTKMTSLDAELPAGIDMVTDARATEINTKLKKKFLELLPYVKHK
ncbi:hypothetical protein KJ652_03365 [Patescibacteria group bacterium]|nr:hypothetical protein [Patescibacteria group bacterium]